MNQYELTLLLNDEVAIDKFKKLIESEEAKIISEEKWGKKTLAYPIKKKYSAFFFNFVLDISQNKVNELKKKLTFDDTLLRYLLLTKSD